MIGHLKSGDIFPEKVRATVESRLEMLEHYNRGFTRQLSEYAELLEDKLKDKTYDDSIQLSVNLMTVLFDELENIRASKSLIEGYDILGRIEDKFFDMVRNYTLGIVEVDSE